MKEVANLYVVERWTPAMIGKKFGVGECNIRKKLRKHGVALRTGTEAWQVRRKSNQEKTL
jgi:hypothetical protein